MIDIAWTSGDKLLHTWSTAVDDLKFWVGYQSHILECLCAKIQIKESMDSKLRVVTWVSATRGNIRFREKSIINTSIL